MQLKDSGCRAGRPVDIAGNHQFSTPLDMLIFHLSLTQDLRGTSVSFRLSCKNRFGKLCVEFDRYSSTDRGWCTRVGVAIERGTERRNRTRRLCKSSAAARRMLCNQRFLPHCAYFQFAQFQFHSWVYTIFVINFHIFFHLDVDSNV